MAGPITPSFSAFADSHDAAPLPPLDPPPEPEPDKGLRQTIADVLGDLFKSGRADVAEGDPATGAQQQAPDVAAQVKAAQIISQLDQLMGLCAAVADRLDRIERFCDRAEAAYESSPARRLARRWPGRLPGTDDGT